MNEAQPMTTWHHAIGNEIAYENVLERWLEESDSQPRADAGKISSAAYRRLRIEKHRTWFALTSAGLTLMLTMPSVSSYLSACGSVLTSWLGR